MKCTLTGQLIRTAYGQLQYDWITLEVHARDYNWGYNSFAELSKKRTEQEFLSDSEGLEGFWIVDERVGIQIPCLGSHNIYL